MKYYKQVRGEIEGAIGDTNHGDQRDESSFINQV